MLRRFTANARVQSVGSTSDPSTEGTREVQREYERRPRIYNTGATISVRQMRPPSGKILGGSDVEKIYIPSGWGWEAG